MSTGNVYSYGISVVHLGFEQEYRTPSTVERREIISPINSHSPPPSSSSSSSSSFIVVIVVIIHRHRRRHYSSSSSSSSSTSPSPSFIITTLDMIPALPPSLAELRDQSADDVLASLKRSPLFMTSLDDAATPTKKFHDGGPQYEENIAVEALKALAYEGSPVEVANNFREHGNECFRDRKWIDARQFYTDALSVLADDDRQQQQQQQQHHHHHSKDGRPHVPEREDDDRSTEEDRKTKRRKLQEALLLNRAACNLELSA